MNRYFFISMKDCAPTLCYINDEQTKWRPKEGTNLPPGAGDIVREFGYESSVYKEIKLNPETWTVVCVFEPMTHASRALELGFSVGRIYGRPNGFQIGIQQIVDAAFETAMRAVRMDK